MASRAVDSTQTLVAVPVTIKVSIPRAASMASRLCDVRRNALKRYLGRTKSASSTRRSGCKSCRGEPGVLHIDDQQRRSARLQRIEEFHSPPPVGGGTDHLSG